MNIMLNALHIISLTLPPNIVMTKAETPQLD